MHHRFFALASAAAVLMVIALVLPALAAAAPEVSLEVSPTLVGVSGSAQVKATIDNSSGDFALVDLSAELDVPPGISLSGGDDNPFVDTSIEVGESVSPTWLVQNNAPGDKIFTVTVSGTVDGVPFTDSETSILEIDATMPAVALSQMPSWSPVTAPTFNWEATDSQSPVASYDVDAAIDQGGWATQLSGSTQTTLTITATEGQLVRVRVRATDDVGNTSAWTEVSTTIDAVPPVITLGAADNKVRGTVRVPVFFSNAGSPVTAKFTFQDTAGGRTGVVTNGQFVSYKNKSSQQILANLRATATDALGRSATAAKAYPVQTRLAPNGLKVLSLSRLGSYVKIGGTTKKAYNGKVTFSAKRIGSKGTKKASRRVRVKKGRFTIRLRVASGRYKFAVSASSTSKYASSSISKNLTVK